MELGTELGLGMGIGLELGMGIMLELGTELQLNTGTVSKQETLSLRHGICFQRQAVALA